MKTAAKVFIIIGIVVGFITIIAPIVGFVALNQMKTQKPSTAVCVLVLLFCNLIGGILSCFAVTRANTVSEPT
ncbi:MAG: hypothetical protein OSJ43_03430 [Oscillospiraceae bacterium]|nr:hypothetical protein [Oscillospiraceae bacterium]